MTDDTLLPPATLRQFAVQTLRAIGMPEPQTQDTADAMIWADLRGLTVHGVVRRLKQCVRRVRAGGTDPTAVPTVVASRPAVAILDAHDAWGQVAAIAGMRAAVERAQVSGAAIATVRNTSSPAAMGYYPTLAIEAGLIGITLTSCPPLIGVPGGTEPILGNQAHAVGIPAKRNQPVLFDSALTMMSTGEMDRRAAAGESLPEGVLLDKTGQPTTDPAAWVDGILTAIGGYRGFGLALSFEVLTSLLAGSARSANQIGHPFEYGEAQGVSVTSIVVDPTAESTFEAFTDAMDRLIDTVHASGRPGEPPPHVPGERGYALAVERRRDGVPVSAADLDGLRRLAADVGAEPPIAESARQ
jgi:LDH2 family malate/lactate/ureidoglycolate dehydrogenase